MRYLQQDGARVRRFWAVEQEAEVLILASGTLTRGGWGWELIAREDEAHAAQMAEQIAAKHRRRPSSAGRERRSGPTA